MTQVLIYERPPLWDEIIAVFPRAKAPGVFFSWGPGKIYYPSPMGPIGADLRAHEAVHGRRQDKMGVEEWWRKYLADPAFCLAEEIPAHQAEYQFIRAGACRSVQRAALSAIARRLASPLYGRLVTMDQAKRLVGG